MAFSINKLIGGWREQQRKTAETAEPVLPYPIRDHFRESARLPKELVRSLVRDGSAERAGFENAALYLVMKASSIDPDLEKEFLRELAQVLSASKDAERAPLIRSFVESAISRMPGDWEVDARNLARLSRHGFRNTDERYRAHATRLAADPRNVCIVGHATFVGIASLIDAFAKAAKKLAIVIPAFIHEADERVAPDERNYPVGYVIEPDGTVRDLLKSDLSGADRTVIVDDVRRTGKTEQQVRSYLDALGITNIDMEPLQDLSS